MNIFYFSLKTKSCVEIGMQTGPSHLTQPA